MAELTALTLMDIATLASAIGTLGLAITSWYQIRQSRRDSLHPLVYAESAWLETDSEPESQILRTVRINLKNYGTGPALDLKFSVQASMSDRAPIRDSVSRSHHPRYGKGHAVGQKKENGGLDNDRGAVAGQLSAVHAVPIEAIVKAGQSVPYMNLAPNQEVSVELALECSDIGPRVDGPLIISVQYRSVFRQPLYRDFTVECVGGLGAITNVAGTK